MASQVWPASLPQRPERDGFQERPPKNTVRTQMDQGPAKIRRRSTAGVRVFSMRFILDSSQLDTLDTFYTDTTKGGALKFDFDDPRSQTTKEFRFRSAPTYKPVGEDYVVDIEMEMLP